MNGKIVRHRWFRYGVIFAGVSIVATVAAVAISMILGIERSNTSEIVEHRRYNQNDHNSICLYLRDLARAQGNPIYPCGTAPR